MFNKNQKELNKIFNVISIVEFGCIWTQVENRHCHVVFGYIPEGKRVVNSYRGMLKDCGQCDRIATAKRKIM